MEGRTDRRRTSDERSVSLSPYAIDVPEGAIVSSVIGAARYLHVFDAFVKGRLRLIRLPPFAFI